MSVSLVQDVRNLKHSVTGQSPFDSLIFISGNSVTPGTYLRHFLRKKNIANRISNGQSAIFFVEQGLFGM